MSKWWKCDLQVATPGEPRFRRNPEWNLTTPEGKLEAARAYMRTAVDAGLDAVVLADHNSTDWIDIMSQAGDECGVVVFPGFELTTDSGSDGVHLILFTEPGTPGKDVLEVLLSCGFNHEHPRFVPSQPEKPAPASKTVMQVLDSLPDNYLVVAPHAFNDNGIASGQTIKGEVRWKALHSHRLGAIDVGQVNSLDGDRWRHRFIRRELTDLPILPQLAFVSTSDAYKLSDLGSRFTWIRMETPTIEAMRQAFIDHDARIVCDWDPRLQNMRGSPNKISHAWVEQLSIRDIATTNEPLEIKLDPRLTVIIGGRGSGKSTIVASLRALYSDLDSLPSQAKQEATAFQKAVLGNGKLSAVHRLAHSGESQSTSWTLAEGSVTVHDQGPSTSTTFPVQVVNQKELFERASSSIDNPFAASQNLLKLLDASLENDISQTDTESWSPQSLKDAKLAWRTKAEQLNAERVAIAQISKLELSISELTRQIEAFDSPESRQRRRANDELLTSMATHKSMVSRVREKIGEIQDLVQTKIQDEPALSNTDQDTQTNKGQDFNRRITEIEQTLYAALTDHINEALSKIERVEQDVEDSVWKADVARAQADQNKYLQSLAEDGVDPETFEQIRTRANEQREALTRLKQRKASLPALIEQTNQAWRKIQRLLKARFDARKTLLDLVSERSGELKFMLVEQRDENSWVTNVRDLLSLRRDAFIDDIKDLGSWLWKCDEHRAERLDQWREACSIGDFTQIGKQARLRAELIKRLTDADQIVRLQLATEVADDEVSLMFLREGGSRDKDDDWQSLATGSPGQRSAAMLGFLLHQGTDPLVLDQPEDDLDTEWISNLIVKQLRRSRWTRQLIVITHNANIPVNADAEKIIVLENKAGAIRVRSSYKGPRLIQHCGPIEHVQVRADIQSIMEGGIEAFVQRERRYNNELNSYRQALQTSAPRARGTV